MVYVHYAISASGMGSGWDIALNAVARFLYMPNGVMLVQIEEGGSAEFMMKHLTKNAAADLLMQ